MTQSVTRCVCAERPWQESTPSSATRTRARSVQALGGSESLRRSGNRRDHLSRCGGATPRRLGVAQVLLESMHPGNPPTAASDKALDSDKSPLRAGARRLRVAQVAAHRPPHRLEQSWSRLRHRRLGQGPARCRLEPRPSRRGDSSRAGVNSVIGDSDESRLDAG